MNRTSETMDSNNGDTGNEEVRPEQHPGSSASVLAAVCVVALLSNSVNGSDSLTALPGMLIIYVMSLAGLLLARIVPFYLPSVAWVSLVGIVATMPFMPGSEFVVEKMQAVDFLAIVTPVLGYAGFAITSKESKMFRQAGWKMAVIAAFVFAGTYVTSVAIAQLAL